MSENQRKGLLIRRGSSDFPVYTCERWKLQGGSDLPGPFSFGATRAVGELARGFVSILEFSQITGRLAGPRPDQLLGPSLTIAPWAIGRATILDQSFG
ncbi:hypothetical protein AB4Y87_24060 [Paenarthrobacter sp. RAF54_2]|uniref:hypothetical protein n=1 Tax=Paenarthrobacter sp. RAF54_2 TaxID=3233061 RepID=UPI003F95711D